MVTTTRNGLYTHYDLCPHFFVGRRNDYGSDGGSFIIKDGDEKVLDRYSITDVLKLKVEDREDSEIVSVMSLFPSSFWNLT